MNVQLRNVDVVNPKVLGKKGEVYALPAKRERRYLPPNLPSDVTAELHQQIDARAAELTEGSIVGSEELVDPLLWECMPKQLHPSIGKLVAYRVAKKLLPLRFHGKTDSNHNLYIRI